MNENLEVLELDKKPNLAFNENVVNENDMADDFFDDDLVSLDFDGLEENNNNLNNNSNVVKVENIPVNSVTNEEPLESDGETFTKVETKSMNNSDVTSNFDVLFDSLYNDVIGANNLISDLIEKKTTLNKDEQLLEDFRSKFEKE